ncbi:MAG: DeoR/GlpR transcriptional regulator [Lachnospiraceae bacterium]|nr:DeoR/GlpR transcriptional regulator [Lachnospiraceae bacterium]
MLATERSLYIKSQLNKKGILSIKEIAAELGVSDATVRRDVDKLEKEGALVRINGGIANADTLEGNDSPSIIELSMKEKTSLNQDSKDRIAKKAAELIQPGEYVFIDGGTTLIPLFRILLEKPVHIVTNNILSLSLVQKKHVADLFVIGGSLIPQYGMCIGISAQKMVRSFHYNRAFFSCTGITVENGIVYTSEIDTPDVKHEALENSDHAYLLADYSKIGLRGFYQWTTIDHFESVITDSKEPAVQNSHKFIVT